MRNQIAAISTRSFPDERFAKLAGPFFAGAQMKSLQTDGFDEDEKKSAKILANWFTAANVPEIGLSKVTTVAGYEKASPYIDHIVGINSKSLLKITLDLDNILDPKIVFISPWEKNVSHADVSIISDAAIFGQENAYVEMKHGLNAAVKAMKVAKSQEEIDEAAKISDELQKKVNAMIVKK